MSPEIMTPQEAIAAIAEDVAAIRRAQQEYGSAVLEEHADAIEEIRAEISGLLAAIEAIGEGATA